MGKLLGLGVVILVIWYALVGHRTQLGAVTAKDGQVEIIGGLPFTNYVFADNTLSVKGPTAYAEAELGGSVFVRLSPTAKDDEARLKLGYWYEIGGGPYQYLVLERGKLAVSKRGTPRRKWTTEFKAKWVQIRTYGPWFVDYEVDCQRDATLVRCTGEPAKMPTRIMYSGSAPRTPDTTDAVPGFTYRLDANGLTESAPLDAPAANTTAP